MLGDPFGTHRSLLPKGGLPQPAKRVDNDFSRLFVGEILLSVETLNIDAASFRQMEEACAASGDLFLCSNKLRNADALTTLLSI